MAQEALNRFDEIRLVIARGLIREFLEFVPLVILLDSFQCFEKGSITKDLYPDDFLALKRVVSSIVDVDR